MAEEIKVKPAYTEEQLQEMSVPQLKDVCYQLALFYNVPVKDISYGKSDKSALIDLIMDCMVIAGGSSEEG